MYKLSDYLNSINWSKEDLQERDGDWMKNYPPYIVNKCLDGFIDSVLYANEMNIMHHLGKDMQYSFYLNSLRKKRRYSPWLKKDKARDLDVIKQYYGYNNDKAQDALRILTKDQIELIKTKLNTGGVR